MKEITRFLPTILLSLLLALFFAGFGGTSTFQGALQADWTFLRETLAGQHLGGNFYGFLLSNLWYTLRLVVVSILGACLLGMVFFGAVTLIPIRRVRQAIGSLLDLLELIPETMYIIGVALAVVVLIEDYQINIPAFPALDPNWKYTFIPALALSIPSGLYLLRVMSVALHDEERADYVVVARAKGNRAVRIFTRHILPNVIASSLRTVPVMTATIASSAMFTEFFFGYQGILFHLNTFASWIINSPPIQKPRAVPKYDIGSIALSLFVLIGIWLLSHIVIQVVSKVVFPAHASRQPGVTNTRFQKRYLILGGFLLAALMIAGCLPSLLTTHSPFMSYPKAFMLLPSHAFPFGTDDFGRDVFARILYGTPTTLLLVGVITVVVTAVSLSIGILSITLNNRSLTAMLRTFGQSLAPLPALAILWLAMMHRNMTSPYSTLQYILWLSVLGIGRGAYAFQSALEDWFDFRFIEGVESIGTSRLRTIFTHLRPWLWRFTAEFAFAEMIRVLALMIELSAFHVFPTERYGPEPYNFVGPPPGILDGRLTWLAIIGPITTYYSFISFPSALYGPLCAIFVVTIGAGFIVRGLRGRSSST